MVGNLENLFETSKRVQRTGSIFRRGVYNSGVNAGL